ILLVPDWAAADGLSRRGRDRDRLAVGDRRRLLGYTAGRPISRTVRAAAPTRRRLASADASEGGLECAAEGVAVSCILCCGAVALARFVSTNQGGRDRCTNVLGHVAGCWRCLWASGWQCWQPARARSERPTRHRPSATPA